MSQRNTTVGSWLASPPPSVALDINATRVIGVAIGEQGGSHVVAAHAIEPITEAVAEPALNAPNVRNEAALAEAIGAVLQRLGQRTRRVALVLPDTVAKVSLIRFEKVPARLQDLEQLIRWQMRKAAPFRIEEAQISWQPALELPGGGREYLVTVARRDIIRGYEEACEAAGAHAGLVDISSYNHINAVLAGAAIPGDWLLVNVAADYATLALVREGNIIFFRNRTAAGEGDLADLVHQTAMYHEDRLGGGGFSRIVLAGISVMGAGEAERLRRTLGERIAAPVELTSFTAAAEFRDRISADVELLDQLAPSVGILLRDRAPRRAAAPAAGAGVA
jgi:type IV pilus assembly protein PilM